MFALLHLEVPQAGADISPIETGQDCVQKGGCRKKPLPGQAQCKDHERVHLPEQQTGGYSFPYSVSQYIVLLP